MTRLLNKPLKFFTVYALFTLLCSIPVYYLLVDNIWLKELDEHNRIIKERISGEMQRSPMDTARLYEVIKLWNALQPGTKLVPTDGSYTLNDSTYTIRKKNEYDDEHELDRFRVLSTYIQSNGITYHLTIETNVEEADETMLAISFITFLFFVLLVGGFIILNRRISKNVWRPFSHTLEKLKSFDLSTGETLRFDKSSIREFDELNSVLEQLIDRNISIYNQQRKFIENASHELQTPLAVLTSKLDLLLQQKDITSEQTDILDAIQIPLSKVSRVNKNLLLLAQIDNKQFSDKELINLSAAFEETVELLHFYMESKTIIYTEKISPSFTVSCNRFLLDTLLSNLVINAIRYTPEGGMIDVKLDNDSLIFQNSGKIPLDEERMFQRFSAVSSHSDSHGLGLAIVREICNRYHWNISYSFANSRHSFSVTF